MQGRRTPDREWPEVMPEPAQPGDFWKVHGGPHGDHHWYVCAPDGSLGAIPHHVVDEHEDGMISVVEQPEANSILISTTRGGAEVELWHGWIRHGVWSTA